MHTKSTIAFKLAPKCEDFMLKCQWLGEDRECKSLFTLEATSDGFCCTFNYERFKYKQYVPLYVPLLCIKSTGLNFLSSTQSTLLKTNLTGASKGLIVLLNGTTSDYFYSNRNTLGFAVQLFSPGNFPDGTTGNLREYILNPGREVYLKLLVTTEKSMNTIRPYGINQRKCLFKDEKSQEYGDHYSYPECLTKCKLRSIYALCNCIPFYAPSDFKISDDNRMHCTLADVKCLERYRGISRQHQVSPNNV